MKKVSIEGMRPAQAVTVVAALVLVLAVAGCGGGSKKSTATTTATAAQKPAVTSAQKLAYEEQMKKLGESLGKVLAQIGSSDQGYITDAGAAGRTTVEIGVVKNLKKGQRNLRAAAVKLAAIKAPDDIKAQHAALRRAVLEYASELNKVIVQVKAGNISDLGSIANLPGVLAMEKASNAITAKGYSIL
jgi:hypothetical protein